MPVLSRNLPASPCVLCGTTEGHFKANTHRPARVSLARFGVEGKACHECYERSKYRHRRGLNVVGPLRRDAGVY